MFGASKNNGLAYVLAGKQLAQELGLRIALHGVDALFDRIDGHHFRGDFHAHRVLQERIGELLDIPGHGRGEEQGLAGPGKVGDDATDVGDKAHIQ